MLCPACQQPLLLQTIDNQQIHHCSNCGSTFFEENSINRITIKSAQRLARQKRKSVELPAIFSCPRDNIFFLPLDEESVPKNVRLFQCPQCKAIFSGPDDLINFKKAQAAKVNYFKIWQIPLPSLRSVVVISFIAVVFGTVILTTTTLQNKNLTSSQVTDIIKNLSITSSNRYLFITFKTSSPVVSKIIFTDSTGMRIEKQINSAPATLHQFVSGDIRFQDQTHPYFYQIVLTDSKGNSIVTEPQTLLLTK